MGDVRGAICRRKKEGGTRLSAPIVAEEGNRRKPDAEKRGGGGPVS